MTTNPCQELLAILKEFRLKDYSKSLVQRALSPKGCSSIPSVTPVEADAIWQQIEFAFHLAVRSE